jgi:YD repeat-containing protein
LPIAKIQNATYDQVASALGTTNLTSIKASSLTDAELRTIFSNLRTALPKSMVTSLTYKLGFGVSSITDPGNKTSYYQYDGLGRLKVMLDDKLNIEKQFIYRVKNQ